MMSTLFRAKFLVPMLAAVAAAGMLTTPASAAPVVFEIDSSASFITILGTADLSSLSLPATPLEPQGSVIPGAFDPNFSLGETAAYGGRIAADVDPNSITFTSQNPGTQPFGLDSGIWAPEAGGGPPGATAGTLTFDPAPYAHQLIGGLLVTAIRDFRLDITSGAIPLAGGSFAGSGALLDIEGAVLDLTDTTGANAVAGPSSDPLGPGVPAIPNFAAPAGSLSGTAIGDTLILPVGFGFTLPLGDVPVDLVIGGVLVAHVIPEPTSMTLAGVCLMGLMFRRRRRA